MANSWIDEANETAKKYAEELKRQSQYLIDQQNQARENSIQQNENSRLNAINELNSGKDTVRETALENAKQANINRVLALKDNQNAMSRSGLSSQGIVGSQTNAINNNYGTNLNSILKERASQLQNIDNQINSTNLEYDNNKTNLMNQYDQNIANLNSQIDANALAEYNTIYQSILNQKQQELENQLAQKQMEFQQQQLEYQKAKDAADRQLAYAQSNTNNYGSSGFSNTSSNNKTTQIKTKYWQGDINPDTKYGTFGTLDENGTKYQPDNVGGEKLSNSGYKVSELFGTGNTGKTGANIDNQKVWKTKAGKYYIWDGSQNKYIDITSRFLISGNYYVSPSGLTIYNK